MDEKFVFRIFLGLGFFLKTYVSLNYEKKSELFLSLKSFQVQKI